MIKLRPLAALRRRAARAVNSPEPNRSGCSYALTVITPICPDRLTDLTSALHSLGHGEASPLAKVPDVHFARWVVIERLRTGWPGVPKRPSKLNSQYLLFSADLTAPAYRAGGLPGTFFRDLFRYSEAECVKVWKNCRGFPESVDEDRFAAYLTHGQIEIGLYYAAFPDLTPDELASALEVRRELAEFALAHQAVTVAVANARAGANRALRDEYLKESASWGS